MDSLPLRDLAVKAPSFIPTTLHAHTSGPRLNTSHVVTAALRSFYPSLLLTVTPCTQLDLLGFAREGHATCTIVSPETAVKKVFVAGASRASPHGALPVVSASRADKTAASGVADGKDGNVREDGGKKKNGDEAQIVEDLEYGKFLYTWEGHEFLLFIVECDSGSRSCAEKINFILSSRPEGWKNSDSMAYDSEIAHKLMLTVAEWMMETKEHVLVFDEGRWKKNLKLWEVTQRASWDSVVLDEGMKRGLREDVEGFFESRDFYERFRVPWKRGIIFHGPPGNGKTLAIQSLMKGLYSLPSPIPTLYVKSLTAENGAQWSIRQIFTKARKTAPCLLIFEDIDSMITDKRRSYFLNEVDGLESNDGIFMLGTTNHLEKLDPALAQRPSRFDRKIFFDRPSHAERAMYARFWAGNIPGTNPRNFSDTLCEAIADVTDGFSFAYLKELFLATLLSMAREGVVLEEGVETPAEELTLEEDEVLVSKPHSSGTSERDGGLDESEKKDSSDEGKEKGYPALSKSVLWPRIKAQAAILRTAIVSEETTGESYAATGEKGVMGEEEDDVTMDSKRARIRLAQRRLMR